VILRSNGSLGIRQTPQRSKGKRGRERRRRRRRRRRTNVEWLDKGKQKLFKHTDREERAD
jgi:hypothetical protein